MNSQPKRLPDWCCASGCSRCEAWAVYEPSVDELPRSETEKREQEKRKEEVS